jgi:CheY-like chemotaxis protein
MNRALDGKRCLLVESDAAARDAFVAMLHALKMEVVQAGSGHEAVALYLKEPFDAVVSDYRMSKMRGDELAEVIKSIDPHQRVILITGYVEEAMESARAARYVDRILQKPCSLEQLAAALSVPAPVHHLAAQP